MAARKKAGTKAGSKARSKAGSKARSKAGSKARSKAGSKARSGSGAGASPGHGAVTGLGGVFFKSSDTARSLAFYRDLGLPFGEAPYLTWAWDPPGPRRKGAPPGVTVFSLFEGGSDYFGDGGQRFMVNLRVAGLDALLARLRAAGVTVLPKIQEEPYGRFAWIVDPDGHRVELWEPRDVPGFEGVPMR